MNSNMFVLRQLAIFFTISESCRMESAAMHSASGSGKERYEPLYLIEDPPQFSVPSLMIFNEKSQKHFLVAPKGYSIGIACPKKGRLQLSIIMETVVAAVAERIPWWQVCDNPVESSIKKFPDSERYFVGFVVYKKGTYYSPLNFFDNLPPYYHFIGLLDIRFEKTELRTVYVWYDINFGEWIQIEPEELINNKEYQKNRNIYGLDVDEAYSLEHQQLIFFAEFQEDLPCPLVKVQLAPAEDFLLENYKAMSRINLNTASIWEKLLPQWRSLETFVRKVARILGRLRIATGTFNTLQWPHPREIVKEVKFHSFGKLGVARFFWKAVMTRNGKEDDSDVNFGILFIMYNHPTSKSPNIEKEPPLCQNIIDKTGWNLHTMQQPDVELTSQIYACALTQDNMNRVEGGTLSISEYKEFNLRNVLKSYYDDKFSSEEFKTIDVIEELRHKKLLP